MSFSSKYNELRRKRKKQQEEGTQKVVSGNPLNTPKQQTVISGNPLKTSTQDIAPVRVVSTFAPVTSDAELTLPILGELDLFQEGALKSGVTAKNVGKAILGTTGDIALGSARGVMRFAEGIGDAINYGIAGVSDLLGADDFAEGLRNETEKSVTDQLFGDQTQKVAKWSVLGESSRNLTEQIGNIAVFGGLGKLGELAKLGKLGITALTTGTMGASGVGSGMSEAYQGDATDEQALKHGLNVGTIEALSELLFGGMGKAVNSLGFSKGITSIDDMFAKKVSNVFTSQFAKNVAEYSVKAGAEGVEELIAGAGNIISKKFTLMSDKDWLELIEDENLLEQFLAGTLSSGFAQSYDLYQANKSGTDFVSGLTQDEQSVVDKEVKNRVAEKEADGKTLTNKEKNKIYDDVLRDLDKGYISTDTIEEVLGGETYKSYKDTVEKEDALYKRFEELGNKENATLKDQHEYGELAKLVDEYKSKSQRTQLKSQLGDEVFNLVKGSRLVESYNERARVYEGFKADTSKFTDAKHQDAVKKTLENAEKSGMNNTNRMRDLVEMNARISGETGLFFDYKSGEEIKNTFIERKTAEIKKFESLEELTPEQSKYLAKLKETLEDVKSGKIEINGESIDGGIVINLNSPEVLNFVTGHELTHKLEKLNSYKDLKDAVKKFAGKNFDERVARQMGVYEGVYDTENLREDVEKEVVADLIGKYIFSDEKFINNLSTENPNLFKRIYNEIKYLCKIATAGSREARELEKVKRAFEKAYKESANIKAKNDTKTSYSLTAVKPVQPNSDKWKRGFTAEDVRAIDSTFRKSDAQNQYVEDANPNYEERKAQRIELASRETVGKRGNGTQRANTSITYDRLYDTLEKEGFNGTILDASSGLGLGTDHGIQRGFDVEDIEPFFGEGYFPIYSDYSRLDKQYDVVISSAVINVLTQEDSDAMVKAIGNSLKEGGRAYITVRSASSVDGSLKGGNAIRLSENAHEWYVPASDNYQRGYETEELKAYLEDVLGDGYTVTSSPKCWNTKKGKWEKWGDTSALVTKDGGAKYSLSAQQKEYFKDSVVRDDNGNLKVMYHGTSKGGHTVFDTYGSNYGLFGQGSYFTDNKSVAESYTNKGKGNNKQVYESYLNITNPLNMDSQGNIEEWQKAFPDTDFSNCNTNEEFYRAVEEFYADQMMPKWEVAEEIKDTIQFKMGYDGITHIGGGRVNADGTRHQVYIAFEPEQIKNIDNIAPTKDADIRYSLSDSDDYSRIQQMQLELNETRNKIAEIEKSEDFKSQMGKLTQAISNDDVDNGIKEYNRWQEVSGYGELISRKNSLQTELENLRKEYSEKLANEEVAKERNAIEKSGLSEADYFRKQAVKKFGYTPYFYDAGYITPNGKMLNFSGEKGRHFSTRGQDHRAIGIIFANTQGTDALNRFMKDGNIRIIAESPAVDVSAVVEPTKEQYSTIRKFIYQYAEKGYFAVDFSDESGTVVGSLGYENNINPTRIINDIKHFYETGEVRQQSNTDRFRYSLSDSEGNKLTEKQSEYFKDSKMRDDNGNLKVMYHGSQYAGFHEFDSLFSDDKTSLFFVDSNTVAKSYSGTRETYTAPSLRTAEDFNNFFEEIGYDEYEVKEVMHGEYKWFELYEDGDQIASSESPKLLYDEFREWTGVGEGSANYKVYLNLTNPLVVDAKNNEWDSIAPINGQENPMSTREYSQYAKENGYDGVIFNNIIDNGGYASGTDRFASSTVAIAFDSNQIKSVANQNPTSDADIRYSLSSMANTFFEDPNMSANDFMKVDYKQTQGYKDYVEQCVNNYRQTRVDFDETVARKEVEDQIAGIVRVAIASKNAGYDIADDSQKRNLRDSKKRLLFSSLEPNSEYTTSHDISTLCDKRRNFAEIYDAIVKREEALGVPQGKRFFDNVDNYFYIHKVLADKGLTQPCRQCYVESMRKNLTPMATAFLELVNETNPNNKSNKQLYQQSGKNKGNLKSNNAKLRERVLEILAEYDMSVDNLSMETLTTEDGLAQLRLQAPLVYEAFNSFYGQSKPKMPKSATPFRFGELTALLTDENGKIKQSLVDNIKSTGGFRLQSYSDFQIENFVDTLQVLFEAGTLGLNAHAYTKVPAFLDATEGTNLKRNISIFMYKDGDEWKLDKNDSFPYDLEEIYDIVKNDKSGNTSIIAVSQNADMSAWIMANDNIGYFIPFHKSGLKMGTVRDTDIKTEDGRTIKGYSGTIDHTKQQTEVWAKTTADHKANTKVKKAINIYSFWDFDNKSNLSKNDLIKKNVKEYINQCEMAGYLPKFRDYVMNNDKVLNNVLKYSKKLGFVSQDATIDDISFEYKGYRIPYGYYKCLGDFGMFTPDGKASPHDTVSLANYDFDKAEAFFNDAQTLRRNEILQQFANGEERRKYRDSDLTAGELEDIVKQKRNEVADSIVAPTKESLSREGELHTDASGELSRYKQDIAPVGTVAKNTPVVESTPTETVAENTTVAPVVEAPTQEYEAIKPRPEKLVGEEEQWAKNKMARADKVKKQEKLAEVLVEEPEVEKKKNRLWEKFTTNFVDRATPIETLALKTGNRELDGKFNTIRYADAKAQTLIGKGAEEKGVKPLDDIFAQVGNTEQLKSFFNYLYHKHNIDRMSLESREAPNLARLTEEISKLGLDALEENQLYAISKEHITKKTDKKRADLINTVREYLKSKGVKNKAVFGDSMTAKKSQRIVEKYETENPEYIEYAKDVYAYNKHLLNESVNGGLISQETADLFEQTYPHYVPIRREAYDGLAVNVPLDSRKTGVNTPIKRATGGSSNILPLDKTMATRTLQTYKAIAKNRFGVELKNTLGTTIESAKTDLDEVIESVDTHEDLLQKGKNGEKPTFTVFENGERVKFEITEAIYDALKPTSEGLATTIKPLNTINNIRRGLLTEYNPTFMLTNAFKDAQDVLINSQHPAQTYKNVPKAIMELKNKNGRWYNEYMENGGEQNTYFDKETNAFKEEKKGFAKLIGMPLDKISDANNFIERIPRLAEYIASRESGRSIDVAMLDSARVTTNFSAGGDVTKLLNRNGATFLNASVQGAMQQVRNVREAKYNGLKGWVQLGAKTIVAGLPAMLLNGLLWDDDEEYEELSDYVKENYYIVAKTEDGQFVRIPKGRTVAVIQNAFEQVRNALTGDDEVDLNRFLELAISNLAPNNPLDNNILAPIMQVANNETWYGEDLVPTRLQDLPNAEQYDESTDAISKWLGEKLNYSPYKINYLLDQYSGGVGDTFLPMLTPEAESGNNSLGGNLLAPLKSKFTTDSVMNNQNVSDFYEISNELKVNAKSSKATDEDVLKYKYFNSIQTELGDLYKEKREIQNSDLSDAMKYEKVRELQSEIIGLTRDALNNYESVNVEGKYANIGDRHYYLNKDNEWQKITDEQLEKQNDVIDILGITPSQYWGNKAEYDMKAFYPEKYAVLQEQGISVEEYKEKYEESTFLYTDDFSWASQNPEKYTLSKAVTSDVSQYKQYTSDLYNIKADKDSNGKSISGSRKEKVIAYVNELDIDYGAKLILYKSEYNADDTYNYEIIDYLNNRDDISYDEMETILKELGFNVDSNGNISW